MTHSKQNNPLFNFSYQIPFHQVNPDIIAPSIAELIKHGEEDIRRIVDLKDPRNFENTMQALDMAGERLGFAMSILDHLESVATSESFRVQFNAIQEPVSQFYSKIFLNEGLWKAVKNYSESKEAKALKGERKRYLEKTVDAFVTHGAELDAAQKSLLLEIDAELATLTNKFGQNIVDSTRNFELLVTDEKLLSGLPDSAVEAAKVAASDKGQSGWRFTLQAPSYISVMTYLDDASIREQMHKAWTTRATKGESDNRQLISKILQLRKEKAQLLGFANFADLTLHDRMAKNGGTARAFLDDLVNKIKPYFESEKSELLEFRRSIEGSQAPALQPWDVGYYSEKMRQKRFNFNDEQLRPYFEFDSVISGLFELSKKLYGLIIQSTSELPVWDPEVRAYSVTNEGGKLIGYFYADFFPRETKRAGAWMNGLISGVTGIKDREIQLGFIGGNFTKPLPNIPALLTHDEVLTLFHEFGHLLHHLLSKVEMFGFAGTRVAWDFVELPSQILENWCWNKEVLDLFAQHYQTKEPLPKQLFDALVAARNFRSASGYMQHLGNSLIDLRLHTDYDPGKDGDPISFSRQLLNEFVTAKLGDYHSMLASFNHLFSNPVGYGAGYYSYIWAETLDADAFSRFEKEGLFSRSVGQAFELEILSRGDSEDAALLYQRFMGRSPDSSALLRRAGLQK